MNGSTAKIILKCGYFLCSKELLFQPNTSRILFFGTAERNYGSVAAKQRNTFILSPIGARRWNVHNSLVSLDYRCLSTTLPHCGQAALKPKSSDRGNSNKQKKDTDKKNADSQVKSQRKIDTETGTDNVVDKHEDVPQAEEKLTLTGRFKKMYKDYWYVLLPVHVFTSTFWFCGFYYLSTSGVDIPSVLESMHISETVINKLRDSSLGHAAIAYLCYKIATPLRYTVTLGGTTLSIKYLSQWGYIRPVPTRAQIKRLYDDQKAKFKKD